MLSKQNALAERWEMSYADQSVQRQKKSNMPVSNSLSLSHIIIKSSRHNDKRSEDQIYVAHGTF